MARLFNSSVFKSRRVRIDLGIAALGLIAFLFLLSGTEPFEAIYEFTRAHEDWDLDEVFSFMLAFTPIAIWFAIRRMRDIVRLNQRISKLAFFDPLTLLPNRSLTLDHLMQMLKVEEARGKKLAVLFVDFDNFKLINDTYGHEAGDELLVGVSDRLNRGVRSGDIVGRIGGDEFVILLANIESNDQVEVMSDRLFKQMRKPIQLKGHELSVTMSIGVAIYPDDGESTTELLRASDTAMYAAKAEGKNNLHYYSKNMNDRMQKRMLIESRLRLALDKNEFNLLYQPLVHGDNTKIKMVEALLRWQSSGTHYSPLDFIPIAEETGLIIDIGLWVIKESAQQIRTWDDMGLGRIDVAVNVSAVQLRHPNFVERVIGILNEVGISPSRIEIEITESTLATDVDKMAAIIAQLRANGIRLAIDDFGTGYSSLSRLKDFDVDKLKIDRSFVQSLNGEHQNELIVQSIISLAKAMEMLSVAEGVETPDQLSFLQGQGCDELQGFYFSRPVPPADIEAFIRAGSPLKASS